MHKKIPLRSSKNFALSCFALGALLVGCSGSEDKSCVSQDGNWKFPNCDNTSVYEYTGPAGVPCTTPDGKYTRADCSNAANQVMIGGGPVQPTGSNPTDPTQPGTGPGVNPTQVTPGTGPVQPNPTSVDPVTPGTGPVTPGTGPVTPGTGPVTPTDPVTPTNPVNPTPSGNDPAGYWRQGDWKGCAWTGIDDQNAGTSITPQDFTGGTTSGAYCVSGKVAATEGWLGVALLGFNLNQDPATANCTYVPVDPNADGPPAVTLTEAGLAVNFVKRGTDKTFTLRAQIQGPNGASDPNDRWCANIIEAQGKELIRWSEFNTECWEGGEGKAYNGEPISAVVFTVPGNGWAEGENGKADDIPYDFCINGLAAGNSPEDAPDGSVAQEDLTGVIGGDATGADFQRVKVSAGGKSYVIQNNNWGNPENSSQTISFVNNSFTITDGPDGSPTCQGCPLSFPSIYIGASGNTDSGKYSTRTTDNLPASISAIKSANSSVRWSGTPGNGANASYDIWFASPERGDLTGKRYNDGLDGFIMLWLYDPPNAQPIGSVVGQARINNIDWDVWVGPRGQGPSGEGADLPASAQAPVVSYVAKSSASSFTGDLKAFFNDAIDREGNGSSKFQSNFILTDVFFGFEIWSGGQGLKVDSFTVDIQK